MKLLALRRPSRQIGNQTAAQFARAGLRHLALELVEHWFDQRRMECVRYGELL
jgi:hypothetical protein